MELIFGADLHEAFRQQEARVAGLVLLEPSGGLAPEFFEFFS